MKVIDITILLLTSLLWSGSFVAVKLLGGDATPMTLLLFRWGLAILILIPIVFYFEGLKFPPKKTWLSLALVGLLNILCYNLLFFEAAPLTNSTDLALISSLSPIFIAAWAALILKEKHSPLSILGALIALLGVFIAITEADIYVLLNFTFNLGDLLMLTAMLGWCLSVVISRYALLHLGPLSVSLYSGIIGFIAVAPFALSSFSVEELSIDFMILILYMSGGATVLAYFCLNASVHRFGPSASGMIFNFNPLVTALIAWIFLAEIISWAQILGCFIVIFGVILFYREENKDKKLLTVTQ